MLCALGIFTVAQTAETVDIKSIASAGHLNGSSEYENAYFGVTVRLSEPNPHLALNSLIAGNRAILLEAANSQGSKEQRHKFVIVVNSAYFAGHPVSTEEFVRGVRQQFEGEGLRTVRAEVPILLSGQRFIESDFKMESKDESYYKAVIFTRMKGYMFGFWMEAANEEQLAKATNLKGRVTFR